jgi:hypothetical protein
MKLAEKPLRAVPCSWQATHAAVRARVSTQAISVVGERI